MEIMGIVNLECTVCLLERPVPTEAAYLICSFAQKIVIGLLLGHQSVLTHKGAEGICYCEWGQ